MRRSRIRRKGGRRFKHAVVNPAKIEWIKRQPCAMAETDGAFCEGGVEAHHEGHPGERDDRKTIPLCALGHHREGPHSRHVLGREGFEDFHDCSLPRLCLGYDETFGLEEPEVSF